MKTLITLSKENQKALEEICKKEKISRAEAIRRAIKIFTEAFEKSKKKNTESAFGIWRDRNESTDEYLNKVRKEWERK